MQVKNYGGGFYVSRFNENKLKLFYHEGEDNNEQGIFAFFDNFGLGYTNGEGIASILILSLNIFQIVLLYILYKITYM